MEFRRTEPLSELLRGELPLLASYLGAPSSHHVLLAACYREHTAFSERFLRFEAAADLAAEHLRRDLRAECCDALLEAWELPRDLAPLEVHIHAAIADALAAAIVAGRVAHALPTVASVLRAPLDDALALHADLLPAELEVLAALLRDDLEVPPRDLLELTRHLLELPE